VKPVCFLVTLAIVATIGSFSQAAPPETQNFPREGLWITRKLSENVDDEAFTIMSITRDSDKLHWFVRFIMVSRGRAHDKIADLAMFDCEINTYGPYEAIFTDKDIEIHYPEEIHFPGARVSTPAPTRSKYEKDSDGGITFVYGLQIGNRRWTFNIPFFPTTPEKTIDLWYFAIRVPPFDPSYFDKKVEPVPP